MTGPTSNAGGGPSQTGRHASEDAATVAFQTPTPPGQPTETQGPPIVLRRARPAVFTPPLPDDGKLIARELGLKAGLSKQSELSRNRKVAGDLPAWEPLPPGEIHVEPRRPSVGS